ncbi:serine hydrolase BPHL isoform X3 [Pelodiscus sinensis]|uniref:serine hydrolase BPHL isoform X3 n=1 Tax=Pelodiscus sinensis TaxID=13735 RepID=UPI003F6C220E
MARQAAGGALLRRLLAPRPPAARGPPPLQLRGPAAASYGTSITSAKIKVNGVHLHYQQTGQGDHAVLLLPGMLGSSQSDFGPQLKSMNKQLFTIVAWDPRGYGHSIPPVRDFPPDFFERDARDAVDLMQALKFKKFSLLGWSDGGITALIAAAKHPALIYKLVVWGANAVVTQEDLKLYNGGASYEISEPGKQLSEMFQNGVKRSGNQWKKCMDMNTLQKHVRPGWMEYLSLLTRQMVTFVNIYCLI